MHAIVALGAPEYLLEQCQWFPGTRETVFAFFCDPRNLEQITPPWLRFETVRVEPATIGQGTIIDYRLKQYGVGYRWRTLIEVWEPGERFVDRSLRGPYILWEHTHRFEECEGGVTMKDRVRYRIPFGLIGAALHKLAIRWEIEKIFAYRRSAIAELLSGGCIYDKPPGPLPLTARKSA